MGNIYFLNNILPNKDLGLGTLNMTMVLHRGIYFPKKFLFFRTLFDHIPIFQEPLIKNIQIFKKKYVFTYILGYISLQKSGAVLFIFQKTSRISCSSEIFSNFLFFRENL